MPKAVAILEGDSSSLVKSIDDAKGAMQKMDKEARKLSDQIRDVADEADKAAGTLVNKIGGPTAVKAIAGIGAAFAGAQIALGAFSGSMAAFAATQGEAGAKAMAQMDDSLNKLSGQLFTAVMGTKDMEEATNTMVSGIEFLTVVVEGLLLPITGLTTLVRTLGKAFEDTSGYVIEASDSLDQMASKVRVEGLQKNADGIEGIRLKLMQLKGETEALRQAEIKREIVNAKSLRTQILQTELQADAISAAAAVVGAQADIEKKANKAQQAYIQSLGEEKLTMAQLAEAHRIFNAAKLEAGQAVMAQQMEQRKGISAANQAQLDEVDASIKEFERLANTPVVPKTNRTSTTPAKPETPELSPWEKQMQEMDAYYAEAAKKQQEADAKTYASGIETIMKQQTDMDRFNAEAEAKQKAAAEKAYADGLNAVVTKARAEEAAKLAIEEEAMQSRKAMALDLFQVKAKLLVQEMAIGKNGFKVMADMARKAIGDAISAKGDEAMAQAAIYAAAFNPQAIPMAAAGVAAYAAAAMLGSSSKKSASSTPASVAPVQAAPVNTSFNLRVDAAFADGESIARQFAMMQRNAQARGLVPVGA